MTVDKIHKYPLRPSSLVLVLKAYAVENNLPYSANMSYLYLFEEYDYYYLTPYGFEWLMNVFSMSSLEFLKSTYVHLFSKVKTLEEARDPNHAIFKNFRGITGASQLYKKPTPCVLVQTKDGETIEREFNCLKEAREYAKLMFGYHSPDEFKLYRVKNKKYKDTTRVVREQVKIILEGNRGISLRKWREANDKR